MDYSALLNQVYFENSMRSILLAIIFCSATYIALRVAHCVVINTLQKMKPGKQDGALAMLVHLLQRIGHSSYLIIALYVGVCVLNVPAIVRDITQAAVLIVVIAQIIWITSAIIDKLLVKKLLHISGDGAEQLLHVLRPIVSIVLWSVAILMILSNMGINITSLIASLGVGGIAVALAIQNVLGDIFDCFAIYLDQPFRVGDFIIVGDHMGVVRRIGLKSTRIESLGGEELVIANRELTSTRVRNFKRMQRRRVEFGFGVTYDTPVEKLKRLPGMVEAIVRGLDQTEFDRAHFKSFGAFSLDFAVVYYVSSNDYKVYMDIQQAINLALAERFAAEDIAFAFPTQTVHVAPQSAAASR